MNSFFTQVSSSIRILGWNRDASARATHLKAAGGNVPSATIERKSMSTKTSIKRIALVAAAALALGGFSAVSANAASATTIAQVAGTGDAGVGGVAGPANSLQVLITTDAALTTRKAYVTVTGGSITSAVSGGVIAANGLSAVIGTADSLTINTPTAGSLVINVYDATGASTFSSTVSVTKSITILATGIAGTYSAAKSSVYVAAGETSTAVSADATVLVAATAASAGDTTTAAATIQVIYRDGNGTNITTDSITATITSGGGNINGIADSGTAAFTGAAPLANVLNQYSKSVTSANGGATFVVWPNGQTGPSVITVKAGSTVLATKTITFYSTTPSTVSAVVKKANILNSATQTTKVFAVTVKDSSSNAISGASVTMTVATGSTVGVAGTCAYITADAVYWCTAAASAATVLAANDVSETYTFTAGTATTTASVKFVSGVLTTVSVAGPASSDPGSKVTYTLTATGANGSPMPDADYAPGAIFTNADPVTNAQLVSVPFGKGETITLSGGSATDYTYAPFSGALSTSWTVLGTASTAGTASYDGTTFTTAGVAKALAATAVAADDVTITANTEATAAANAATDAANQAADAADNATQAAAEALAAVNTLATTVATLIDGIKSQIKALNTLILAIKKKIKA